MTRRQELGLTEWFCEMNVLEFPDRRAAQLLIRSPFISLEILTSHSSHFPCGNRDLWHPGWQVFEKNGLFMTEKQDESSSGSLPCSVFSDDEIFLVQDPASQAKDRLHIPSDFADGTGPRPPRVATLMDQERTAKPADGPRRAASALAVTRSPQGEDQMQSLLEEEDARIEAIYQFNANPRRNIGVLCRHFKREATPGEIAVVLHNTPGLLGEKIGEFLVHPDNEVYLKEYFWVKRSR
jgi:hypothetical protein